MLGMVNKIFYTNMYLQAFYTHWSRVSSPFTNFYEWIFFSHMLSYKPISPFCFWIVKLSKINQFCTDLKSTSGLIHVTMP